MTIFMEHSLLSISKWESKNKIPFLDGKKKTHEQLRDYIKCMSVTQNVSDFVYDVIFNSRELMEKISAYIEDDMTATTFASKMAGAQYNPRKSIVTSEVVYYWMVSFNIPFECQKWHINRLMTLIRVCSIKNTPAKKMSKREIYRLNAELNAERRAQYNTTG